MDKIQEIIDPMFKQGTNAKGQTWTLKQVRLVSGKTATTFDDVAPGDTVKATYNEKYDQWKVSKPKQSDIRDEKMMDMLTKMYTLQLKIAEMVGVEAKEDRMKETASEVQAEMKATSKDNEQPSIDDIPF